MELAMRLKHTSIDKLVCHVMENDDAKNLGDVRIAQVIAAMWIRGNAIKVLL